VPGAGAGAEGGLEVQGGRRSRRQLDQRHHQGLGLGCGDLEHAGAFAADGADDGQLGHQPGHGLEVGPRHLAPAAGHGVEPVPPLWDGGRGSSGKFLALKGYRPQ
jgi:hypothetical protein